MRGLGETKQAAIVRVTSLLVLLSGLLAINQPLFEKVPERLESLLVPLSIDFTSRTLDTVLGLTLVYIAIQLWQRKLAAWWLATSATTLLALTGLLAQKNLWSSCYFLIVAASLLLVKGYFQARSEIGKMRRGVTIFLASILFAVTYGTFGFWVMDQGDFASSFSVQQSIIRSVRAYTLIGNADLTPRTNRAVWFLDSLAILGASSILFGIYSLFRPLAYEYSALPAERRRMLELLKQHSTSTDDFFKLWPHDKSYYFAPHEPAGLAYGVAANVALAVGDPAGNPTAAPEVIRGFSDLCLTQGWLPCFMYVSGQNQESYESSGYELLKIGEDAVVALSNFSNITSNNKHFRNIRNRFEREGYTVELAQPPHAAALLQEVTAVSADWLKQPDRKEWQFLAGSFSRNYLAMGPIFVAKDRSGHVQAFANQIPTYVPDWATIDLMRYRLAAPNNIMDYLLMMSLLQLHEEGYRKFNLGLAPLAGLGEGNSPVEEKLLGLLYRSNQKLLSLQGLRRFKDKFEPAWESKYMAYRGGARSLPRIAFALNKLMRHR